MFLGFFSKDLLERNSLIVHVGESAGKLNKHFKDF